MNIISFSLWGNNSRYIDGAIANQKISALLFPKWKCHWYVGQDVAVDVIDYLVKLGGVVVKKGKSLQTEGALWRYEASLNNEAERIIFWDADSLLSTRLKKIVEHWILSNKPYMILRDHPIHVSPIMAGLLGVCNSGISIINDIVNDRHLIKHTKYGFDEIFLGKYCYPKIFLDAYIYSPYIRYPGESTDNTINTDSENFLGKIWNDSERSYKHSFMSQLLLPFPSYMSSRALNSIIEKKFDLNYQECNMCLFGIWASYNKLMLQPNYDLSKSDEIIFSNFISHIIKENIRCKKRLLTTVKNRIEGVHDIFPLYIWILFFKYAFLKIIRMLRKKIIKL